MQTQPFILDQLNEDRRTTLYTAAAETRVATRLDSVNIAVRLARLLATAGRQRPALQSKAGTSNIQPFASR